MDWFVLDLCGGFSYPPFQINDFDERSVVLELSLVELRITISRKIFGKFRCKQRERINKRKSGMRTGKNNKGENNSRRSSYVSWKSYFTGDYSTITDQFSCAIPPLLVTLFSNPNLEFQLYSEERKKEKKEKYVQPSSTRQCGG